jgi:hypothetical protein
MRIVLLCVESHCLAMCGKSLSCYVWKVIVLLCAESRCHAMCRKSLSCYVWGVVVLLCVEGHHLAVCRKSLSCYVQKVVSSSITWLICVGNLQPALVYTWVWCLRCITGVHTSISLPHQHTLMHYPSKIKHFTSPNGVCSSITESMHITAVKKPWWHSNRNNTLPQIMQTISQLYRLNTLHKVYNNRDMLDGKLSDYALSHTN